MLCSVVNTVDSINRIKTRSTNLQSTVFTTWQTSLIATLIISEDGESSDADDAANGGTITVDFDALAVVTQVGLLDIEEEGSFVTFFGSDDSVIETVSIEALGNNSVQTLDVRVEGVKRIDITLAGSGAVTGIDFSFDTNELAIAGLADSSVMF